MGLLSAFGGLLCMAMAIAVPSATETAVANGDTRTLHLYHTHTGESIDATFRVDGHYDPAVLRQLNHFLRDWRNNDEIGMDPRLFDTLWEVYRTAGATQPIQIYSAYRSPETNAMLRRRSRAVAEHSQHMLGKAMDTTIPGFPMERIREVGMRLQHGGVGWYPSANFVHLDVGSVRSWPRMNYDQLARLFPDGKTVHIASNGQVLPGYEQARAEIMSHGGTDVPPPQESKGFFAWLFGGSSSSHEDDEDRRAVAAAPVRPAPPPQASGMVAYAGAADETVETPARPEPAAALANEPAHRSTEQRAGSPTIEPAALMPMPPHRPVELAALPVVPLPPIRPLANRDSALPVRLANLGNASARVGSARPASPGLRQTLPPLITQGEKHLPSSVLAYSEPGPDLTRVVPLPVARPLTPRAIGLRAAFAAPRHVATTKPAEVVATAAPLAAATPRLLGLRRAAQNMASGSSL